MEEEEIVKETPKLKRISDEDFIMEETKHSSRFFNLAFMKVTKKRSGDTVIEPGKPMYGVPFFNCVNRIIKHKTKKKFQDRNITLKEYLKEYFKLRKELSELFAHELPKRVN